MKRKYLLGWVLLAAACDENTASAPVDYAPLLRTLTENVILPEQAALVGDAERLVSTTRALESGPDADTLANAQGAWRATRAAYRLLDAAHFGPIADLGISERIDAGPANPADIDAIVSGTATIDANAVAAAGGKVKGFLGLEYLLFAPDALAKLQGDGQASRRRALARAMAEEIASSAHQLEDAWATGKGGYASEVEGAGSTSKRYPTQRAAVDDLVGGVGYALEIVVAVRLAVPLGKKSGGVPDPNLDPTKLSDSAVADMTSTLSGIRAFYQGEGFSSRVRPKSAVLDDRAVSQLGDCAGRTTAISPPFATTLINDPGVVDAAYTACKALKATWNTDVTSALGATLKPADTDGD